MGWLLSLLVGVLTAIGGCLGAGFLASVCVDWYRISSREGGSGYFILFMGLFGAMAGFVVGVVGARIVAGRADATFLKALGVSLGSAAAVLLVIAGFAWLGADFPPTLEGKELVVDVEVRMPAGFEPPAPDAQTAPGYVTITADGGGRRQSLGPLRWKEARQEEGRWIVPATLDLSTTDPGKSLGVDVGKGETQYARLPLAGRPTKAEMVWSPWLTGFTRGDLAPVPPAESVSARTRVQYFVPPPPPTPGPTREELEAKEKAALEESFRALAPDAPVEQWLVFTRYGAPEPIRQAAAAAIAARPGAVAELSALIRGTDVHAADVAMRAVSMMKPPPAGLAPAVADVAREIADTIRAVNATPAAADPSYEKAAELSVRFTGWSLAAWALHGRDGVDFLPDMRELLALASVRTDSYVMQQDVARVCRYYVKEWGGEAAPAAPGR